MTDVSIQLTGPLKARVPIIVQLIGPADTNTAHSATGEVVSRVANQRTDSNGLCTLSLTPTDALDPEDCFYRVTAKFSSELDSRWNIYLTDANAPPAGGPYDIGLPQLQVVTPVPPDWVPVATVVDADAIAPLLDDYFDENPEALADAVDAALAANPPLLVANNGSDVTDDAAFRLNIRAASDSDVAARFALLEAKVSTLETFINSRVFVTAAGVDAAEVSFPGGVPQFDTDP